MAKKRLTPPASAMSAGPFAAPSSLAMARIVEGARNTGIDISVPEGTPVKAAENGVVIYSGSGLKDLGNTVLVRHDDGTVTVYGNAAALNVKRGDKVTRGQSSPIPA